MNLDQSQQETVRQILRICPEIPEDVLERDIPLILAHTGRPSWGVSGELKDALRIAYTPIYGIDIGHFACLTSPDRARAVKAALEDAGIPLATVDELRRYTLRS